jgi:hypothetical protein
MCASIHLGGESSSDLGRALVLNEPPIRLDGNYIEDKGIEEMMNLAGSRRQGLDAMQFGDCGCQNSAWISVFVWGS